MPRTGRRWGELQTTNRNHHVPLVPEDEDAQRITLGWFHRPCRTRCLVFATDRAQLPAFLLGQGAAGAKRGGQAKHSFARGHREHPGRFRMPATAPGHLGKIGVQDAIHVGRRDLPGIPCGWLDRRVALTELGGFVCRQATRLVERVAQVERGQEGFFV